MLFNSVHFLIFFIIITSVYFSIPHKYRWVLLLSASCYFYMAFVPIYILILGVTIVIDYFAGIFIEKNHGKKRKLFLILSLFANIGILVTFKYFNFINENLTDLLHSFGFTNPIPFLSILLPIGLSFHTFQAMSYTIEVYRGNQKAEKHFGIYSLYVMFYPQLVAGPIERPQNLLHQFKEKHYFDYCRITDGLKLMTWGLFKKVVIADRLAIMVNNVYESPENYDGISLTIATIFFAFQIYCDFSGYSDIAIGAAKVMGFDLMKNFNLPYFSKSISEFWSRWHISLSTWFRDYLYIPLGGNRVKVYRWYLNLLLVFVISGFWHGANWTFIIWGALHGFYLVSGLLFNRLFKVIFKNDISNYKNKLFIALRVLITFSLVCVTWIFFRAKTIKEAFYILTHLLSDWKQSINDIISNENFSRAKTLYLDTNINIFLLGVCSLLFLLIVQLIERKQNIIVYISSKSTAIRWISYFAILALIILYGIINNQQQFIYFQF